MDKQRFFLYAALVAMAFVMWTSWQKEHPQQVSTNHPSVSKASTPVGSDLPSLPLESPQQNSQSELPAVISTTKSKAKLITVKTDVLQLAISAEGGAIVEAQLLKYPTSLKDKAAITLFNNQTNQAYVAQNGYIAKHDPKQNTEQAIFTSAQKHYQLRPGQKQLEVKLSWKSPHGVTVNKIYQFKPNSYTVKIKNEIKNTGTQPWQGYLFAQLKRQPEQAKGSSLLGIHAYQGAALSSPEKAYQKISYKDMAKQNLNQSIQGGWAAMLQHYFLSAWIPNSAQPYRYYTKHIDQHYIIGMLSPQLQVAPGETATSNLKLYVGPAIASRLEKVAPHLKLTIDYGMLWFISEAIFWLMKHIYSLIGNWGWSIVLVTAVIKLLFYKLSASSYRSMANMRKLQPKIQALKERFGDDKQKLTQATMELYKKEKMNPVGGCLPILVQIPVFLALYWVLLESVQLRQAPFIFWIQDLSIKDPFYVLPILMGATMLIQQKLNPTPPDPTQAKLMMLMPVIFTVLFVNFPAGLVLYWLVNNSLSILQQWWIMRRMDTGSSKKKQLNKATA